MESIGSDWYQKIWSLDITKDYIEFARETARQKQLDAEFILSDIRDLSFVEEFDVVINMGDVPSAIWKMTRRI